MDHPITAEEREVDLDRLMTPEQFAEWLGVSAYWVRTRLSTLPGVIRESREVVRFHPRTYLAKRLNAKP